MANPDAKKPVSGDTKLIANMLLVAGGPVGWIGVVARGMMDVMKEKCGRFVTLQADETYQDNVDFIHQVVGPDVQISSDMPPIHETVGLVLDSGSLLQEMDAAMKATMVTAIKAVQAKQSEPGAYISWKGLQKIFDSDGAGMFHPCAEHDKTRCDSRVQNSELFVTFGTSQNMENACAAETMMKQVVGDAKIWDSLRIDRAIVQKVFSSEGVPVGSPVDLVARSASFAHIAIDAGVIRFPRNDDPFFKLWRLRVIVFRSESAVLCVHSRGTGIFCEFQERRYCMDKRFSDKFTPQVSERVNEQFATAMAALGMPM